MKIIQLIIKNSSTLDFTLPIFWSLRSSKIEAEIVVLYWSLSKEEKIFASPYTLEFMKKYNVSEMTLADFSKKGCGIIVKISSYFAKVILPPSTPIKEALVSRNLNAVLDNLCFRLFQPFKSLIEDKAIDYDELIRTLNYDLLFYDNRSKIDKINYSVIKKWMDEINKIVVLTPHAPHYIRETDGFSPLIPDLVELTSYSRVWYTHKLSRPWVNYESYRSAFCLTGYPGFDSTWLKHVKGEYAGKKTPGTINVLIPGRKFYAKKVKKINKDEFVTQTYEEALDFLNQAHDAINSSAIGKAVKINLIYKPHPSSQLSLVEKLIKESKFQTAEIFTDLVYFALGKTDFVISPYTTMLLIPCFAEIPVILANSLLQERINSNWAVVDQMYRGLEFFSRNNEELKINCEIVLNRLAKEMVNEKDQKHLSKYFPSSTLASVMDEFMKTSTNQGKV